MISGVAFDLGRTLITFEGDWPRVIEESVWTLSEYLQDEGFPIDRKRFATSFQALFEANLVQRQKDSIERPLTDLLRKALIRLDYSEPTDGEISKAVARFYSVSEEHWLPIPRVNQVLDQVLANGFSLALISNAGDGDNVSRLMQKANLTSYFDPILISANVGFRKPHHSLFDTVVDAWGVPPDQLVMVGDSLEEDILGAKNAGWHQIWLKQLVDSPHNQTLAREIQPEFTANHLQEVPEIIQTIHRQTEAEKNGT